MRPRVPAALAAFAVVAVIVFAGLAISAYQESVRTPRVRTAAPWSLDSTSSADVEPEISAEPSLPATATIREQAARAATGGTAGQTSQSGGSSAAGSGSSTGGTSGSAPAAGGSGSGDSAGTPSAVLTLEQRKACYWELIAAEDRAVAEAEAAYPMESDDADVDANVKMRLELTEKYQALVRAKYRISREAAEAIIAEGMANGWPMPPIPQ
jgi:hypothetical protein